VPLPRAPLALRRLRRAVLARRRPLAALCAAAAVAAGLQAASAPPPARTLVLTAAHDLAAGVVVRPEDLTRTPFDPASVPAGVLPRAAAVGRTTAGPLRAGEALTDARLVTRSLLDGYPGLVAVPVRVGDPGAVRLLRAGDRVDLLAADPRGATAARVLGRDVPVLAIPRAGAGSPGLTTGALVVLALPDATAASVAQASVASYLSVVLTH
jgi:Flp pilus assembly protein CpaB